RWPRDWSSDVCSSDLCTGAGVFTGGALVSNGAAIEIMGSVADNQAGSHIEGNLFEQGNAYPYGIRLTRAAQNTLGPNNFYDSGRSEERRVGKECRSR